MSGFDYNVINNSSYTPIDYLNESNSLKNNNNELDGYSIQNDDVKNCWVCFSSELNPNDEWVSPCKCIGSLKYVHQNCIQQWIDTRLRKSHVGKIKCSQCTTEYIFIFPETSNLVYILGIYDHLVNLLSPYAVGSLLIIGIYWSAISYGILTLLQVMGCKNGKTFIESSDPLILFVFVPSIPVFLVFSKFIKWENHYLRFWKNHSETIPILKYMFKKPPVIKRETAEKILLENDDFLNLLSTRIICSALILPSISIFVGKYFFKNVSSNLHRTILGGAAFLFVKGLFKIYLKQSQYINHSNRKILNFSNFGVKSMKNLYENFSRSNSQVDLLDNMNEQT